MNIGCHISIAGGIEKAPKRATDLGCETMQIFTHSPQGGKILPLTKKICQKFKVQNSKYKIRKIYVHAPYYINFASSDNRIRYGSVSAIRKELERANLIGAKYVIVHLGSAKNLERGKAIKQTIKMLQKTLDNYQDKTKLLIENTAGEGNIIGDTFKELSYIIKQTKDSSIAGICLDTQHSFASGYNWKNFDKTLKKISKEINLKLIKFIHANDSKVECGSRKDRHEHIGKGKIGLNAFKKIVKFAINNNIDMVCETEGQGVAKDIKLLKKFRQILIKK
ncbi:MAG: deoxyribonuclease IV [Xanthomonadaceae bacterium]|nr:deoxyribonuclease IV [Rhodospirillaceae bacterium]NIA18007.1 deoxyribonuclease IV [Xanthomonadaceae bacterium]